ncbi:unnamed protein product [Polarella glacialis]|uniref:DUF4604 domain-containing protein n=1 Tax=Polarella glacialis TaxID=89957 RepID=A0A813J4Y3_POLGL|nr:unnamed protein product [Polarella glacialis]|mmetsp:Transcript_101029/g.182316  ORF Transcript_101029/g.182316 Transcript_101029/m.182316 type:complete len:240 (+) Transcript_101029:114-833(+)
MSDDEGRGGGKGKGKDKGKKGEGKKGGGGGGGKSGGSKRDGGGSGGGMSVTRLKVLPKFLQDMVSGNKPEEAKRGLNHAKLEDKSFPLGRNDDDEYDVEGAQIVGSQFTADDVAVFQKKRKGDGKGDEEKPKGPPKPFFASEAKRPNPEEIEEGGPVRFKRKSDRDAAVPSSTSKKGVDAASAIRKAAQAALDEGADSPPRQRPGNAKKAEALASRGPAATAKRKQLSFDADDNDDDDG